MNDDDKVCNCSQCGCEIVTIRNGKRHETAHRIHGRPWCSGCVAEQPIPSGANVEPWKHDKEYHGDQFYSGEW